MLRYGSRRIRKQRTIRRPRRTKRMRRKTKAALCSRVRKEVLAEEEEVEEEEKSGSDAGKVLLWMTSAILSLRDVCPMTEQRRSLQRGRGGGRCRGSVSH